MEVPRIIPAETSIYIFYYFTHNLLVIEFSILEILIISFLKETNIDGGNVMGKKNQKNSKNNELKNDQYTSGDKKKSK